MKSLKDVGKRAETLDEREFLLLQTALVEDARPMLRMREVWPVQIDPDWVQEVAYDAFVEMSDPELGGKYGSYPMDIVDAGARAQQEIFYIRKALQIHWKDLASSRQLGRPLDTKSASEIGRLMATQENKWLANGATGYFEGLLDATGKNTVPGTAWSGAGDPYEDVRTAIAALQTDNFYGPYQLIVSPTRASDLRKMRGAAIDTTFRDKIEDLLQQEGGGSVLVEAAFPDTSAILTEGKRKTNYLLHLTPPMRLFSQKAEGEWTEARFLEGLATEIYRAESICEITGLT